MKSMVDDFDSIAIYLNRLGNKSNPDIIVGDDPDWAEKAIQPDDSVFIYQQNWKEFKK